MLISFPERYSKFFSYLEDIFYEGFTREYRDRSGIGVEVQPYHQRPIIHNSPVFPVCYVSRGSYIHNNITSPLLWLM